MCVVFRLNGPECTISLHCYTKESLCLFVGLMVFMLGRVEGGVTLIWLIEEFLSHQILNVRKQSVLATDPLLVTVCGVPLNAAAPT